MLLFIIAAIVIIIIVAAVLHLKSRVIWKRFDGVNYVHSADSTSNVIFLGNFATEDECQAKAIEGDLSAYTWYTPDAPSHASSCYGVKEIDRAMPGAYHKSGRRINTLSNKVAYLVAEGPELPF